MSNSLLLQKRKKRASKPRDDHNPAPIFIWTTIIVSINKSTPNSINQPRLTEEMQSLQEKASEWSGVDSADAFAIDNTNLFQKLGLQTFINLSTNFYNRWVYVVRLKGCLCFFANDFLFPGFMMMKKKSGLDPYLWILRKKKRFRISMSFLCREWEGLLCILKGKVCFFKYIRFLVFVASFFFLYINCWFIFYLKSFCLWFMVLKVFSFW